MSPPRLLSARKILAALLLLAAALVLLIIALAPPSTTTESRRASTGPRRPQHQRACTPSTPCLAILIDDLGRRPDRLRDLLALPLDLTYSILPHARHSALALVALRAARREYWLHLPLQPTNPRMITDEPLVLSANGPVEAAFIACVAAVPGAIGVNGHMGSAFSEDRKAVARLMGQLRHYQLALLDSKTSVKSQVCAVARPVGIPCLERDVFLDDRSDPAKVVGRLEAAMALAKRRGWAIAVGHPERETIEALTKLARSSAAAWVVKLSSLYTRGESRLTRPTPGT